MNILKLGFADTYDNAKFFFESVLSRRYKIIRDDKDPDYLIFGDGNFGYSHRGYTRAKKIFFTGENVRPNYADCSHAITFDHENSPKHYRLPLYVLEMWACEKDNGFKYYHLKNKQIDVEKEWAKKKVLAAYIQSNPRCEPRNRIVQFLMQNNVVASGGPHMNNIGHTIPRNRNLKLDFFNDAYFGLALENGAYPGYVTEKILDSYYANTIPVYWGSQTVHKDFNPKSYIDVNNFSKELLLSYLKHLANNKNEYCDILSQPAFVNDIPNEYTNIHSFLNWFDTFVYEGIRG